MEKQSFDYDYDYNDTLEDSNAEDWDLEDEDFDDDDFDDDDFDDDDFDDDDFDDDDGKARKLKKLKGKKDLVAIAFLFIGFIGVLSIVCGLFVGKSSKGPGDYYGIYYTVVDSAYFTYHIEKDDMYIAVDNGLPGAKQEIVKVIEYEYVPAKKAQTLQGHEKHDGQDALVLRTGANEGHILWIVENSPYKFMLNTGDVVSKQKYNFAKDMGDPKNYYYQYISEYGSDYSVSFRSNGTASFVMNGITEEYNFAFVSAEWCKKWLRGVKESALILYQEDASNNLLVFVYKDRKTLVLNDEITFRR